MSCPPPNTKSSGGKRVSRQIKNFEDELSVVLFLRQPDGLILTEAGTKFI
ncbi:helix-turn-helix domain-containing protein [Microcoleus sp. herbarium2]